MSFIEFSSGEKIIDQVIVYVHWSCNSIYSWLKSQETTWNETEIHTETLKLSVEISFEHSQDVSPPRQIFQSTQSQTLFPLSFLPQRINYPKNLWENSRLLSFSLLFRLLYFLLQKSYLLIIQSRPGKRRFQKISLRMPITFSQSLNNYLLTFLDIQ